MIPQKKERRRDHGRGLRAERRAKGLCVQCGVPAAPDRVRCRPCLAKQTASSVREAKSPAAKARKNAWCRADRQRRSKEGRCQKCPRPALPGKTLCATHHDAQVIYDAAKWQKTRAALQLVARLPREYWLVDEDGEVEFGPYDYRAEAMADRWFRRAPDMFVEAR